MGAKAAAARKGATIPSFPKGKKKKNADEGSIIEVSGTNPTNIIPTAATTTDKTTVIKDGKKDTAGEVGEAQEEQDQEVHSSVHREADTPKIITSEHRGGDG
eukprot:1385160-Pleurochrysis_carterae.AAC.1